MSFASARSRWGDVGVVAAAQLLAGLGTFLVMTTQLLVFQQRGAGGYEVSALIIVEALPMVVLGRPIGWLVDRVSSRLLLVVAGIGATVACLALSWATTLPTVLAGVVLISLSTAVSAPTRQALVPQMVVRDDLPRAAAIGQTAGAIGMMGGPALAGILVGTIGAQPTIRFATVGFAATVIAALLIRTQRGGAPVPASSSAPVPAAPAPVAAAPAAVPTWRLGDDAMLRLSVWGLTAVLAVSSAVNVVLVFFVMGTLGSTPQTYGFIDASWMVGMLLGGWLIGLTIRPGSVDAALARRLIVAAAVICAAVVATGSVTSAWWVVPTYLVGGAANAAVNVFAATLVGRRVPSAARGRASTALSVRVQAGSLIGYVAGGLLLVVAQPRWVVLGCGLLGIATALAFLPALARLRTTEATPAPEPAVMA